MLESYSHVLFLEPPITRGRMYTKLTTVSQNTYFKALLQIIYYIVNSMNSVCAEEGFIRTQDISILVVL